MRIFESRIIPLILSILIIIVLSVFINAGGSSIYDLLRLDSGYTKEEAVRLMELPQDMWDIIDAENAIIPAGSKVFLVTRDSRTAIEFIFSDTIRGIKHLDLKEFKKKR